MNLNDYNKVASGRYGKLFVQQSHGYKQYLLGDTNTTKVYVITTDVEILTPWQLNKDAICVFDGVSWVHEGQWRYDFYNLIARANGVILQMEEEIKSKEITKEYQIKDKLKAVYK